MTYMEIASYLSVISIILAEARHDDAVSDKLLEAVRTAEMIVFRMALDEIAGKVGEGK